MIDGRSRSREWILESCQRNKVNDPTLMEKTIRAFSLLEALAKSGCPFLFKGGSALMLQLGCRIRGTGTSIHAFMCLKNVYR